MDEYRGTIWNLDRGRRLILALFGLVLPLVLLVMTVLVIWSSDLWPVMIVPDVVSIVLLLSISGTLFGGHSVRFFDDSIDFRKGWAKGRIDFGSIERVYRVNAEGRDTVVVIFRETAGKPPGHRCLCLEQVFSRRDRDAIFKRLSDLGRGRFEVSSDASIEGIRSEKSVLNWRTV